MFMVSSARLLKMSRTCVSMDVVVVTSTRVKALLTMFGIYTSMRVVSSVVLLKTPRICVSAMLVEVCLQGVAEEVMDMCDRVQFFRALLQVISAVLLKTFRTCVSRKG